MKQLILNQCPGLLLISAVCYCLPACSEGPKERYIRICTDASTTQKQIDSCKCMASEYDKVLNKEEYDAFTTMMAKASQGVKQMGDQLSGMDGYMESDEVDKQVLISAMIKVQPLHNAQTCGYGTM